jgi:hypothetical protein
MMADLPPGQGQCGIKAEEGRKEVKRAKKGRNDIRVSIAPRGRTHNQ